MTTTNLGQMGREKRQKTQEAGKETDIETSSMDRVWVDHRP